MKYNTKEIKANNPLEVIIGQSVTLKQNGNEFEALCPFHAEKTPSFRVVPDKGFAHCFGCGKHISDSIEWTMEYHGVDFQTACDIMGGNKEAPDHKTSKRRITKIEKDIYEGIEPITPVPDVAELLSVKKRTPKIFNPKRAEDPEKRDVVYKPSMVFEYRNIEGMLLGYVLRIDFGAGKKITPTVMWCKLPDGSEQWCHYSFPEPRPLYRRGPADGPIMIVEGEKAADAAHRLMPHYKILTWPQGGKSCGKAKWSELLGRDIVIWGDADQPGEDTAIMIAGKAMDEGAKTIKIIQWDKDKPKGWDAADAEAEKWDKDKIIQWAKKRVTIWPPIEEAPTENHPPIESYDQDGPEVQHESEAPTAPADDDMPFRALGYNKNIFYYLPQKTQQIMELSAPQHTKNNLVVLAPHEYWKMRFPAKSKDGVDWDAAFESLVNLNSSIGIFDGHDSIRGRGAWIDEGRPVLHLGNQVIIEGKQYDPKKVESKYVYEANKDLNIPNTKPATSKEANKLINICGELSWERELSAQLLAGWCVIAPVCGILNWRPHIWLTGSAGSGKTTVIKDIIQRVVGPMALMIEGKTTEAGIRQQLQQDARPIIFDESESEDQASANRMQAVLDLARVASSGGRILKGTVTGGGMSFSVRSCFCFSSINTSVQHYADESRITKLILKSAKKNNPEEAEKKFKEIHRFMLDTFTQEYSAKMLTRSLANLSTLQKNCETFVEAAARVLKSRRLADQVGNMLAGTYLCYSKNEISLDEAVEWIEKYDWSDHTAIASKTDEERLIDKIATHRIRITTKHGSEDSTLGELIIIASSGEYEDNVTKEIAEKELKRFGIKTTKERVYIANRSEPMKKVLLDTPWSGDWGRPLKDIDGGECAGVMYFTPGIKSRATRLPVELFKA